MAEQVTIYTDGACSGNPGPGGFAYYAIDSQTNKMMEQCSGGEKATTNNRMELMAVITALESFLQGKPNEILVVTDSKYVLQGMTEWIKGWKAKNWIGSNKQPVKNRDLWERLDKVCAQHPNLKWKWVKGHSGDVYNEIVDKLAVEAIPKE
jgi:ribonuclease HI